MTSQAPNREAGRENHRQDQSQNRARQTAICLRLISARRQRGERKHRRGEREQDGGQQRDAHQHRRDARLQTKRCHQRRREIFQPEGRRRWFEKFPRYNEFVGRLIRMNHPPFKIQQPGGADHQY